MSENLKEKLITFARHLAAEQWYASTTWEPTSDDLVYRAKAEAKAEIGRLLLECLQE